MIYVYTCTIIYMKKKSFTFKNLLPKDFEKKCMKKILNIWNL